MQQHRRTRLLRDPMRGLNRSWIAALAFIVASVASAQGLAPQPQQREVAHLTSRVLQRFAYVPVGAAAVQEPGALQAYLLALDHDRMIFTHADIASMAPAWSKLDKIVD